MHHVVMHMFRCQGLPDSAFPRRGGEEQRALHEGRGILQHILLVLYLNCKGLVGVTLQRQEKGHLNAWIWNGGAYEQDEVEP